MSRKFYYGGMDDYVDAMGDAYRDKSEVSELLNKSIRERDDLEYELSNVFDIKNVLKERIAEIESEQSDLHDYLAQYHRQGTEYQAEQKAIKTELDTLYDRRDEILQVKSAWEAVKPEEKKTKNKIAKLEKKLESIAERLGEIAGDRAQEQALWDAKEQERLQMWEQYGEMERFYKEGYETLRELNNTIESFERQVSR